MSGNDSTIKYEFLDSSKNFIYDARERACEKTRVFSFVLLLIVIIIAILHKKGIVPLTP